MGHAQKSLVINSDDPTRVQPGASPGRHTVGERQTAMHAFLRNDSNPGEESPSEIPQVAKCESECTGCDAGENYSLTCSITKCTFPYCCIVGCIVCHYKTRKAFLSSATRSGERATNKILYIINSDMLICQHEMITTNLVLY